MFTGTKETLMRAVRCLSVLTVVLLMGMSVALAQSQPGGAQPPPVAPAKPYKPVAVTLPQPVKDVGLDALRKALADAVKRRDRAALGKLVVGKAFFWERPNGDGAIKAKSGADNLAAALGLADKDSVGWDMLAGYAEDPTAAPSSQHKGALCAPADPSFDGKAFEDLLTSTQTDVTEWGYPVEGGIVVHAKPESASASVEKLGLAFVRVMPEDKPASAAYLRIVTPSGKTGYVTVDAIAPIGNDQICYVKDGGAWKIGGYIGGGEAQ
jgi:hypothetical protein